MKRMQLICVTATVAVAAWANAGSAAQWLANEKYGNGTDGNLVISANQTDAPIDASCSGTITTSSLAATNASFAAGQIILIQQTRGTGAGNWELNVIQSYTAGTITTKYPLTFTYTDSGVSQAQVRVLKQYASVTVNASTTWTAKAWDGNVGGVLAFICNGTTTITGNISANARGFRGGYGATGDPGTGNFVTGWTGESQSANLNASGGGGHNDCGPCVSPASGQYGGGAGAGRGARGSDGTSGGGGAGYGAAGNAAPARTSPSPTIPGGEAGQAYGNAQLTQLHLGSGGGGGGTINGSDNNNGPGGAGAGAILIISRNLSITGTIAATGGGGVHGSWESGGGGSGGSVLMMSATASLGSTRVTASGGAATSSPTSGAGAVGRIALYYGTSYSGSTSPTMYVAQDNVYKGNEAPTAFSLVAPSHQVFSNSNQPTFTWGASTDPESLPITYTLKLSTSAGFTEPVYRTVTGISSTSYTPSSGQEIADGTYYWKVIASDGEEQTTSNETRQLTIDTQLPDIPVLTQMLAGAQSGKFEGLLGTGETGSSLAFYRWDQGSAGYVTAAGSYTWNGSSFSFTPTTALDSGSVVYFTSRDTANNTTTSRVWTIACDAYADVSQDCGTSHTGSGCSMQLGMDTVYRFKLAVNGGQAVTVTAWLRRNADYSGSPPSITLDGLGLSGPGTTASMSGPAGTWEQLTVGGTPGTDGILTLTVETYSTAANAGTWIDDISVSQ